MRGLRILLIVVVILGVLFVIVDRVAVHFAEGEAADKLKANEQLATTPDVDIKGFPFLTQVAGAPWMMSRSGSRSTTRPPATPAGRSGSRT